MITKLARSLEHGEAAAGAGNRRAGFAFAGEMDLAFALGWPHMITLREDDSDPAASARALVMAYPEPHERAWPRQAAQRAARALAAGPTRTGSLSPEAEAGLAEAAELRSDEAAALFREYLAKGHFFWMLPSLATHLFEALLGPSATLELLVSDMEAKVADWMQQHIARCVIVHQLGYHLLRVPAAEAEAMRGRLAALFAHASERTDLSQRHVTLGLRELDLVLHGRRGLDRSAHHVGPLIQPWSLLHLDDADFVFEQAQRVEVDASALVEARLAFLAGERWLDEERKRWSRYKRPKPAAAQARVVAHLGAIRSPKILALMLEMSAKSKVKTDVLGWFVAHADYARPWLEERAAGAGDDASAAAKVLKKLR